MDAEAVKKKLLNEIDCKLDRDYQWSMGRWTREGVFNRAKGTVWGHEFIVKFGEDELRRWANRYFYQSVPHFDKNKDEQPPQKRPRAEPQSADGEDDTPLERNRKRHRTDPGQITDDEIGEKWLKCRQCFKARDSVYM